jgi:hypothetical protein
MAFVGQFSALRFPRDNACCLTRCRRTDVRGFQAEPSAMNLAAMANLHNRDDQNGVFNLVDDPIISDADAVELTFALELDAATRTGKLSQAVNRSPNSSHE